MRAVLTYHSLDDSGSVISISPAQFRRHLEWLARSRVRVCTLEQLVQESSSSTRSTSDGHAVALTFDDGFANFASIGILLGGIGAMAPTRRGDIARLGGRALLGGFLATMINAAIASMLM